MSNYDSGSRGAWIGLPTPLAPEIPTIDDATGIKGFEATELPSVFRLSSGQFQAAIFENLTAKILLAEKSAIYEKGLVSAIDD